jgi:hypothetical protein
MAVMGAPLVAGSTMAETMALLARGDKGFGNRDAADPDPLPAARGTTPPGLSGVQGRA